MTLAWLVPGLAAAQWRDDTTPLPSQAAITGRSLLLPGWGQHVLGQRRAWGYAAVEATLWALWANRRSLAGDARDGYRDLAWSEARGGSGVRADGDWAYYETLSKWTRSGAFDADAQRSGLQPEEDESTFNGSIWRLARDVYFPGGKQPTEGDPAFEDALSFYRKRAYGATYVWDWSGKDAALHRYKDLIRTSDDRFRQATTALGAVLANHLLAATDAFVSSRMPGDPSLRLLPPRPGDPPGGWRFVVRLGSGR